MNKLRILSMTAIAILLVYVMAGCTVDAEKTPSSMTFMDEDGTKEFTIDSNYNFKVTFINPTDVEQLIQIKEGTVVKGKITDAKTAWDSDLTGTATKMSSTNGLIDSIVGTIDMEISLDYTINEEGAITAVTPEFTGNEYASQAQLLMGKTYYIKQL